MVKYSIGIFLEITCYFYVMIGHAVKTVVFERPDRIWN
jgi:hypothetical protein